VSEEILASHEGLGCMK